MLANPSPAPLSAKVISDLNGCKPATAASLDDAPDLELVDDNNNTVLSDKVVSDLSFDENNNIPTVLPSIAEEAREQRPERKTREKSQGRSAAFVRVGSGASGSSLRSGGKHRFPGSTEANRKRQGAKRQMSDRAQANNVDDVVAVSGSGSRAGASNRRRVVAKSVAVSSLVNSTNYRGAGSGDEDDGDDEPVFTGLDVPGKRVLIELAHLPILDELFQLLETKHEQLVGCKTFPLKYYDRIFNLTYGGIAATFGLMHHANTMRLQITPEGMAKTIQYWENRSVELGHKWDKYMAEKLAALFKTVYFLRAPSASMFDELKQFMRDQEVELLESAKEHPAFDNFFVRKTVRKWNELRHKLLFWRE